MNRIIKGMQHPARIMLWVTAIIVATIILFDGGGAYFLLPFAVASLGTAISFCD